MSIQSLGVGSGLDLESLVRQLLAAERSPKQARFNAREEALDEEISAIGKVKSKLSEFEDIIKELQLSDNLSGREPTIENPSESNEPFSATPSNSSLPGTYDIAVEQLARGSRIETASAIDGGFTSSDDVVLSAGTADLTFKIGNTGDEFTITVAAGTTLAELREQINSDENNFGISANIINTGTADGGARLVFTSDITGEGNDLSIVNTNNAAELNRVATTDSSETASYLSAVENAQNAIAYVDGIQVQSDTNKFENTIQSVRFDVKSISDKDSNGDPIASQLTIGFDQEGLRETIDSFVEKFNSLVDELDELTKYGLTEDAEDGALAGDSMVRGIRSGLASILGSSVSGSEIGGLFALGIELTADGKLEIGSNDFGLGSGSERLTNALNDNFDDVSKLFSGETGIASRILAFTEEYTQGSGLLSSREDTIKDQQSVLETDRERFEQRMETYEATLRARYLNLDSTVASLQQTGNALFASLGF
uniref:flagellar filament capping protein FliD n=1 Tax=Ningiella ruwaisensis TaxID=2364274 RepID=UPI0010A008D7|nr:flagellar filament capping protein FliD [Ningiella ruwaisensis]